MTGFQRAQVWLSVATALFVAVSIDAAAFGADDGKPSDSDNPDAQAATLIQTLKSTDFDLRQKAAEDLRSMGARARAALELALKTEKDPETVAALRALLAALGNASLTCEVYDRFGKCAEGIKLEFTLPPNMAPGQSQQTTRELTTDAHGLATMEGLQQGPYYCSQPKLLNAIVCDRFNWISRLTLNRGVNTLRLTAMCQGAVQFQALDAITGRPVDGAEFALLEDIGLDPRGLELDHPDCMGGTEHLGRATEWRKTGADGRVTITSAGGTSQILFCRHDEYLAEPLWISALNEGQVLVLNEPVRLTPKTTACGHAVLHLSGLDGKPLLSGNVQVLARQQRSPDEEMAWNNNFEFRLLRSRYTQRKWESYNGWQVLEAAKDGTVALNGLRPGDYQFSVLQDGAATAGPLKASIVAGATVELPFPTPVVGGEISGAIKNAQGKPATWGEVFLIAEDDPQFQKMIAMPDPHNYFRQNFGQHVLGPQMCAKLDNDGKFSFTHVAPARYSLFSRTEMSDFSWTHKIDVVTGQQTRLPDIAPLPEKARPKAPSKELKVAGNVIGPDSQPCSQAKCVIAYHGGAHGVQANPAGEFTITIEANDSGQAPGVQLLVFFPGCQPFQLDLGKSGPDLGHLEISLQSQRCGNLTITVHDTDGHPIPDCQVSVAPSASNPFEDNEKSVSSSTNSTGEAKLEGLAIGRRKLNLHSDGFYIESAPEVTVEANATKPLKIEMRKMLALQGVVTGIPKEELSKARVVVDAAHGHSNEGRECSVDGDGRFNIVGLMPGLYCVRAEAPGWIEDDIAVLSLRQDTKDIVLKLCRPGCLKLDLGPERRGYECTLCNRGQWDPFNRPLRTGLDRVTDYEIREMRAKAYNALRLDSRGCGLTMGIMSGNYDLLVKPYEDSMGYTRHDFHAQVVCRDVSAPEIPPDASSLAKLTAASPQLQQGNASIGGLVRWKDPKSDDYKGVYEDLDLYIVGGNATAMVAYRLDELVAAQDATVDDPNNQKNRFMIRGLPAGEYRIAWRFNLLDEELSYIRKELPKEHRTDRELPLVLLKTVRVENGQNLDVGEFVYEPNDDVRKLLIWDFEREHPPVQPLVGQDASQFKP